MAVTRETIRKDDRFDRAQAFTTTPTGEWGWTIADTSAAGTPTYLCATDDGGAAVLTLEATSEAQNVCLFQNDVLPFDLRKIHHVDFDAKVSGVDSVTTIVFGVGSARNNTPDSVSVNAWFRMEGSASTSNLVAETDDNTTDNDDKATGATLSSTYKRMRIDFSSGLSDVRFYVDGARVATGTTFDMSAVASGQNVQMIVQLQKASGTGVAAVTLTNVGIQYTRGDGA
jgi:hypothetical protein